MSANCGERRSAYLGNMLYHIGFGPIVLGFSSAELDQFQIDIAELKTLIQQCIEQGDQTMAAIDDLKAAEATEESDLATIKQAAVDEVGRYRSLSPI